MVRDLCRWFYHLEGVANGLLDHPPVHVFVTVYNRWCAEEDWPLPGTNWTRNLRPIASVRHRACSTKSLLDAPLDELFEVDLPRFDSQFILRVLLNKAQR